MLKTRITELVASRSGMYRGWNLGVAMHARLEDFEIGGTQARNEDTLQVGESRLIYPAISAQRVVSDDPMYPTRGFSLRGEFKAGVFTHNHFIEKLFRSELPDTICSPTVGAYLMADQTVWRSGTRQAALFMQAGYTPSRESFIDLTAAMGVNVTGLFAGRENDAAGLAVTTGRFTGGAGCETAIELTYRINFNGPTYLQPDLQYIIHPSGRQSGIPHCLACFLRLGVSL